MSTPARASILLADDEQGILKTVGRALREEGYEVVATPSAGEAQRLLADRPFDVFVVDYRMPDRTGLELIRELAATLPEGERPQVVMMTAHATVENAIEAMKRGAYDYLTKPFDLDVIDAIIEKVDRAREMSSQVTFLKEELKDRYQLEKTIIGNSPAMREIYKTIGKVAPSDVTVLVQGMISIVRGIPMPMLTMVQNCIA